MDAAHDLEALDEFHGMKIVVRHDWAPDRFELFVRPASPVEVAARLLGASRAEIPGLWNAPGYPELTNGQLIAAASLYPKG